MAEVIATVKGDELFLEIPRYVASSTILIGYDPDLYGDNLGGWEIAYFGTSYAPPEEQLAECLARADLVGQAIICRKFPDGTWLTGRVRS